MPHSVLLKDGTVETPFGIRDVLEIVGKYAGEEVQQYLGEYVRECEDEREAYKYDCEHTERELEQFMDNQTAVLNDIREAAECVEDAICADRLNREGLRKALNGVFRIIDREL